MSVLQDHLYSQFLTGSAADVSLHVKGSWEAVYQLHRVVLIQAGYFSSLFAGGFLESQRPRRSQFALTDEVTIRFDDPNITRAAFELCIARLYGGGPALYVSPALIPTTARPLTPAFSSPGYLRAATPPGQHDATPRFLLSLLATAAFLSIPTLVTQALESILSSVGPYTVVRYLRFADGLGIGPAERDDRDSPPSLEHIGQKPSSVFLTNRTLESLPASEEDDAEAEMHKKLGEINLGRDMSGSSVASETASTVDDETTALFNYGHVSQKVGEACVCFLTRWALDILPVEEVAADHPSLDQTLLPAAPVIWARGGLSARWVRALVSSDDLFVKGELERYEFACRVVELRRRQGVLPAEESEWRILFHSGIYYTSMPFDDLTRIVKDVSPTTEQAYVPRTRIHASHWTHSLLRAQIMVRPTGYSTSGGSPVSSPSPQSREHGIGFCLTTKDIAAKQAGPTDPSEDPEDVCYYPVLPNSSVRIGVPSTHASGSGEPGSQFTTPPPPRTGFAREFFGLQYSRHTPADVIAADPTGTARWSPFPPLRFGVEFWNVLELERKVFSHTVWYAGSLYNVYAQLVRKRGLQLGLYLHRQSSVETIPRLSAPPAPAMPTSISAPVPIAVPRPEAWIDARQPHARRTSLGGQRPTSPPTGSPRSISPPPRYSHSGLPIVSSSPPMESMLAGSPTRLHIPIPPATTPAPVQPFRDPRSTVVVYFGISAFVLPAALIRFTSAPDSFTVGQSWGWKSSSLYHDHADTDDSASRDSSVRATVVIGLV